MGEEGNHMPSAMMIAVVTISGQLARLWRKGMRLVRMMWMMSVCVSSDSTNQPVWNRATRSCVLRASQPCSTFQQPC